MARPEQLKRRKEIYEAKYPESKKKCYRREDKAGFSERHCVVC